MVFLSDSVIQSFSSMLFAHLLGDFVFQYKWMIDRIGWHINIHWLGYSNFCAHIYNL